MRRRWYIGIGLVVALVMSFSACGLGQKKSFEIMYGGAPLPKLKTFRFLVKKYMETHPNVKVKMTTIPGDFYAKMKVIAATGKLSDIIRMDDDWTGEYMSYGFVYPLTDKIEAQIDKADYFAEAWKPFLYKGNLYGIPYDAACSMIFYNKNHFDEAGLDYPPRDPKVWTRELFFEYAKKLTKDKDGDGKTDQWGFIIMPSWFDTQNWLWCEGANLLNEDKTKVAFDQHPAVDVFQWKADLRLKHRVAPPAATAQAMGNEAMFAAGIGSMILCETWDIPKFENARKAGKIEYGQTYLPSGRAGSMQRATFDSWGITKNAKDFEVCWDFATWMSSAEGGQPYMVGEATFAPPNKKVAYNQYLKQDVYWDPSLILDILENRSRLSEISLQGAAFWDAMNRVTAGIWLGEKTAEQAAKDAHKIVDAVLAKEAKFRPFMTWEGYPNPLE